MDQQYLHKSSTSRKYIIMPSELTKNIYFLGHKFKGTMRTRHKR